MYLWICEFANLCICVFGYFCVVSHVSKTWKTIFGSSMTGWWEVGGCADSNTTVNSAPGNGPHTLPGPSHCTLRSFWLRVCLFVYVCLLYVSIPVFIHSRQTCPTFKCSLLQGVSRLSYCDISCMYTCTWITTITMNTIALGLQRDDPADMRIVSEITGDKATNCAFCLVPDPPAM